MQGLNDSVSRARMVQQALVGADLAFSSESKIVYAMLDCAQRDLEVERRLADHPDLRIPYEEHLDRVQALIKMQKGNEESVQRQDFTISSAVGTGSFDPPTALSDQRAHEIVQRRYQELLARRKEIYKAVRIEIDAEPCLKPHMKKFLEAIGREDIWAHVGDEHIGVPRPHERARSRIHPGPIFAVSPPAGTNPLLEQVLGVNAQKPRLEQG